MHTKLTLRLDEALIVRAKNEAEKRGKSVSQMVGEFFSALGSASRTPSQLPPLTTSLVGALKRKSVSESDYKRYIREKYL